MCLYNASTTHLLSNPVLCLEAYTVCCESDIAEWTKSMLCQIHGVLNGMNFADGGIPIQATVNIATHLAFCLLAVAAVQGPVLYNGGKSLMLRDLLYVPSTTRGLSVAAPYHPLFPVCQAVSSSLFDLQLPSYAMNDRPPMDPFHGIYLVYYTRDHPR